MRPLQHAVAEVLDALADASGFPVGDGRVPAGVNAPPYYVVDHLPGPAEYGSLADPSEMAPLVLQVTAAGADARQSRAMGDLAHEVLVGRTPDGGWQWPLAFAGGYVAGRRHDAATGTDPGATVTTTADRYVLEVHTT